MSSSTESGFKVDVVFPQPAKVSLNGTIGPVTFNYLILSVEDAQELWDQLSEALARAKGHIVVGGRNA